jgi:hypothetical protein
MINQGFFNFNIVCLWANSLLFSVLAPDQIDLRNSFTVDPNEQDETERIHNSQDFASLFHKDAYLLFRALCKLSMKGIAEDPAQDSNVTIQNK